MRRKEVLIFWCFPGKLKAKLYCLIIYFLIHKRKTGLPHFDGVCFNGKITEFE